MISGGAYKYFIKNIEQSPYRAQKSLYTMQDRLYPQIKRLKARYGVIYELCGIGMKARKIESKWLYDEMDVAFSKSYALISWQNQGYAYLSVSD